MCEQCLVLYPGREVHSSSSVQQQRGDIHVTVVSCDVQRGEPALFHRRGERRDNQVTNTAADTTNKHVCLKYQDEAACWGKKQFTIEEEKIYML